MSDPILIEDAVKVTFDGDGPDDHAAIAVALTKAAAWLTNINQHLDLSDGQEPNCILYAINFHGESFPEGCHYHVDLFFTDDSVQIRK